MTTPQPSAGRPTLLDLIAAFFAAERAEPGPGLVYFGPCDRAVPEPEAEASL